MWKASLYLCAALAAPLANAATIERTDDGAWDYLESDAFHETTKWPKLRATILDAWSGTVREEPFDPSVPFGASVEERLYTNRVEGLEVLHLMASPDDAEILSSLADLYDDLEPEDVADFADGVIVEATQTGLRKHDISVFFFRRAEGADTPATVSEGTFSSQLIAGLPNTNVLMTQNPTPIVESMMFQTSAPPDVVIERAERLLRAAGLEIERLETQGAVQVFGGNATGEISLQAIQGDDDNTMVLLNIAGSL